MIAGGIFLLLLADIFTIKIHLLRWFRILLPANAILKTLVAEVSQKMQVPVSAAWILPSYVCNAVALPQIRQLIFTDRLLLTLSDEQTKAVCAHELGHLRESRKLLFVRIVLLVMFFTVIFMRPFLAFEYDNPHVVQMLVIYFIFMCLNVFFARRMARQMEIRADKAALENQMDTAVYARALAHVYEANQMPAVMPRRSRGAHPDLYDRMLAAGLTPDFPKPSPPKRRASLVSLLQRNR
jgi:Zn-dependent protease with chaperone function